MTDSETVLVAWLVAFVLLGVFVAGAVLRYFVVPTWAIVDVIGG